MPFLDFVMRPSSLTMVLRAHWAALRHRMDFPSDGRTP